MKAIIIGATSGIGRELAVVLSNEGYELGLTGRRMHLLQELQSTLSSKSIIKYMDITDVDGSRIIMQDLLDQMENVELIILSSGTGHLNVNLEWNLEKETIDTNVVGISALIGISYSYLIKKGRGHLCAISSIASIRGGSQAPAYNASKAFLTNYLEGLYCIAGKKNKNIVITEIKPGFVNTDMAQGEGMFWVAPVHTAAKQIYVGIKHKKRVIYVTKRWRVIAFILKLLPIKVYTRIS